jgi:acylphosphatase
MLVARRVLVTGRVQGVGFRFFVEEAARFEGVRGWVRNRPDGRVEAFLEGDQEAVTRIEQKMRRGPAGARVSTVIVDAEPPSGIRAGFEIVRD